MSDHFAVLALLDVDAEHGRRDRNLALARARRVALGRLRDQAALSERQGDLEALRVGSEEAALQRQRATEQEQAEAEGGRRARRLAAQKRMDALRDRAFGEGSLFSAVGSPSAPSPAAPASLEIPAMRGLPGGDAQGVWQHLRVKGEGLVPVVGGL